MSRTRKDKPHTVQAKERESWRSNVGYPSAFGGAWSGIQFFRKYENKRMRRRAQKYLNRGEEPPPEQHRHNGRWWW